jgi:nucleolar protein 15
VKVTSSDAPAKSANVKKKPAHPAKGSAKTLKSSSNGDSLTADGVNGILEHSSEEDVVVTIANKEPSTSMQAEAQRTVDREIADEVATDDESDDAGAALLAGFESDGNDSAEDEGLDPADMGDLNLNKQQRKKLRQATRKGSKEGTGTVYVGRIPRGFYESQMRQYFSQFGTITNLRLSRNRTTGASKHFAFIEFESNEVAKIVAQTMDNYLMFGHILKCKYAPSESLHPDTWKGANKRFKKVPYNKIEKRKLEEPKTKDQWEVKIAREQGKREKKLTKAQSMGYDYELPQIQGVDAALEHKKLTQQEQPSTIEPPAEVQEPSGAIEPPTGVPKDAVALKGRQKKEKKVKSETATGNADTETPIKNLAAAVSDHVPSTTPTKAKAETTQPTGGKKAKKAKKAAATSEATVPAAVVDASIVTSVPATEDTKLIPTETKKTGKKAKKAVTAFIAVPEASNSTAQLASERPKFAFHPDEIAELTKPTEKTKVQSKKEKKTKSTATDAAAAQMQLNAELNGAVTTPKKNEAVESDTEIAATAAVLPTPAGGEKKVGKKAKASKKEKSSMDAPVKAEVKAEGGVKKAKKTKKAAA